MAVIAAPRAPFRCIVLVVWALALSACATLADDEPPAPGYDLLAGQAQVHAAAGQIDEAVATFERAAAADPARTEPWRQIARLRFGAGEYALALAAARQVLRRDPADPQASDMVVASGMQVAIETLRRLHGADAGQVEAHRARGVTLAALMEQVFGAEMLISEESKARLAREAVEQWRKTRAESPAAQEPPTSPLDILGGD